MSIQSYVGVSGTCCVLMAVVSLVAPSGVEELKGTASRSAGSAEKKTVSAGRAPSSPAVRVTTLVANAVPGALGELENGEEWLTYLKVDRDLASDVIQMLPLGPDLRGAFDDEVAALKEEKNIDVWRDLGGFVYAGAFIREVDDVSITTRRALLTDSGARKSGIPMSPAGIEGELWIDSVANSLGLEMSDPRFVAIVRPRRDKCPGVGSTTITTAMAVRDLLWMAVGQDRRKLVLRLGFGHEETVKEGPGLCRRLVDASLHHLETRVREVWAEDPLDLEAPAWLRRSLVRTGLRSLKRLVETAAVGTDGRVVTVEWKRRQMLPLPAVLLAVKCLRFGIALAYDASVAGVPDASHHGRPAFEAQIERVLTARRGAR